jgi:hypothetical protein
LSIWLLLGAALEVVGLVVIQTLLVVVQVACFRVLRVSLLAPLIL